MSGTLIDTYVAAIQHDLVDLPPDATRIGVVRRPTPWLHGVVDENRPELGPPDDLLAAVKDRATELESSGLGDGKAHNRAMDAVDYDDRYRAHLAESADARRAIEELRARLEDGEPIALVCFENTDEKRCHRTILREEILAGDLTAPDG